MGVAAGDSFGEYVRGRSTQLLRTAYLLVGDWHWAEDVVQTALAKAYLAWDRIEKVDRPDLYVRRILVTTAVRHRRGRDRVEEARSDLDRLVRTEEIGPEQVDQVDALQRALVSLPPRQRAAVVIRYYEDRPVAEVAEILGCSVGTVKSQSARGLDKLRAALGEEREEPDDGARRGLAWSPFRGRRG